jgi:RND family efflux transporter MFP subunit
MSDVPVPRLKGLFPFVVISLVIASFSATASAEMIRYGCVTEPHKDAMLSFTVPGRIVDIYYREGRKVKAGQILVDLENKVEALELKRRDLIHKDKSELQASKAQSETFSVLLASTKGLFESTGSISRDELYRAELEYNSAEADHQRLLIAEQREKVEFELAQANLARRSLAAPFDGTIVDVMLDEGEICEANQPMLKLVDVSKVFLVCNIDEPAGRLLKDDQVYPVEFNSGDESWNGEGKVVFVAPIVDPASGLLRVRLSFDNANEEVRPGVPGYIMLESNDSQLSRFSSLPALN